MKSFPKNNQIRILALVTAFIIVVAGILFFKSSSNSKNITKVVRDTIEQKVMISGSVEPFASTIMSAPYDGYLKDLHVKLGQQVKKGDPLFAVVQALQSSEATFPLRAPFSGTIVQLQKSEGQAVKQTDPKDFILRLDDLTRMFVNANVPEIEINKVKVGQEANLKATAISGKNYNGKVESIALASLSSDVWYQRNQVNYQVRIAISDADSELKSGMSVNAEIVADKRDSTLILPHEFVKRDDGKYYVTLKNGKSQEIKTGLQNETSIEITEGLNEGDEVLQIDYMNLQ